MRDKSVNSSVDRGERGAAAILVGLSLLALMGFAALAIDAGLGYDDRRGTQNAADNAALAAAWEQCNPEVTGAPDPIGAAMAVAAENGYDDADSNVSVNVIPLPNDQYQVEIQTTDSGTFGPATPYAADSITVVSSAIAECEVIEFLGGYAIFAESPTCSSNELNLSGASKIINGGIHSNGDLNITGSDSQINGDVTYFGGYTGDDVGQTQLWGDPYPSPLTFTISDFQVGGSRADAAAASGQYYSSAGTQMNNNWLTNHPAGLAESASPGITLKKSGIYYSDSGISLNNVSADPGVKATFVSAGPISVTGSGDIESYESLVGGPGDPGLLMYSSSTASNPCTHKAITWSVSDGVGKGVLYAPRAQVDLSAADYTLNGSIIGWAAKLSGSNFEISWVDNPDADPNFEVNLLK